MCRDCLRDYRPKNKTPQKQRPKNKVLAGASLLRINRLPFPCVKIRRHFIIVFVHNTGRQRTTPTHYAYALPWQYLLVHNPFSLSVFGLFWILALELFSLQWTTYYAYSLPWGYTLGVKLRIFNSDNILYDILHHFFFHGPFIIVLCYYYPWHNFFLFTIQVICNMITMFLATMYALLCWW